MLIARDLHPRMKLRGRRARIREEGKKAFSLFSYLSHEPFAIIRTFIPTLPHRLLRNRNVDEFYASDHFSRSTA